MAHWNDDEAVVEVWRTWGEAEARIVQGLLESNGIHSAISGESTRLTHGFTLDGLAEVRILVREADRQHALEVISQAGEMTACPRCGNPARSDDRTCRFCKGSLVD
jgi:hypothetical protein